MFWGSVAATLPLLPIALATEAEIVPHSLHGWAVVVGLSLLSQVLGQSMINWAMGHLPAAFSSLALLLNPLFAALCAWPILGEALTLLQMLSGLGVILGILLARRARAGNGRANRLTLRLQDLDCATRHCRKSACPSIGKNCCAGCSRPRSARSTR